MLIELLLSLLFDCKSIITVESAIGLGILLALLSTICVDTTISDNCLEALLLVLLLLSVVLFSTLLEAFVLDVSSIDNN